MQAGKSRTADSEDASRIVSGCNKKGVLDYKKKYLSIKSGVTV